MKSCIWYLDSQKHSVEKLKLVAPDRIPDMCLADCALWEEVGGAVKSTDIDWTVLGKRSVMCELNWVVFHCNADKEIGYDDRVNPLQPQNDSDTARENWVTS